MLSRSSIFKPTFVRLSEIALIACLVSVSAPLIAATVEDRVGSNAVEVLQGKKILLAGATGSNGSVVLEQLVSLGLSVRAMSRDADRAREKFGADLDWVEADVTEPASLDAAVTDIDVVIWAVATAMPIGGNRPEKVDYEGLVNMIAAAKNSGVRRVVIITSANSGNEEHWLNWFGKVLVWKARGEQALIDSGLEYVIVGPARISSDSIEDGQIKLGLRQDYSPGQFVHIDDLASVVIAAAGLPEAANRIFSVETIQGIKPDQRWQRQFADMPARD